ncbi:MAG: RagB/SusD family nutrient uptake outer membrane protein [Prevotella sp.]|nr:RagB/SusD family nutrient uptake outer membrane protein [Prevotella sp.]
MHLHNNLWVAPRFFVYSSQELSTFSSLHQHDEVLAGRPEQLGVGDAEDILLVGILRQRVGGRRMGRQHLGRTAVEACYTGAATGQYMICDKNFYERISDTDWRKKWWQAPEGSSLRDQSAKNHIEYLSADDAEALPTYAAVKFRPGQGNTEDYNVGSATATPLMRVEEMYFIKAEAEAHSNPAAGLATLTNFMTQYRDPSYSTSATTEEDAIDEIIFQKRVELWGEGQLFFDYKRLNLSVTRGYEGTPFFDRLQLNTNGRPAWMNLVISVSEYQDNQAVNHWNNPDPSGLYTQWKK